MVGTASVLAQSLTEKVGGGNTQDAERFKEWEN